MKPTLTLFIIFIYSSAFGIVAPFPIGARSWGVGNAVVALPHQQSYFSNPAGLGFLAENQLFAGFHTRFDEPAFTTFMAGGTLKTPFCVVGLGAEQFGDRLYNETKAGVAFAKKQGRVSLAAKVNYVQISIENLTTKNTLLTEFGVLAELNSVIRLGFHAYNVTGGKLFVAQNIPTILRLGTSVQASKQVLFLVELEKSTALPLLLKAGLEYEIYKNFVIRSGINSKPNTLHWGFSLRQRNFDFSYALHSHAALGLSQHLTLGYSIKKKRS